MEFIFDKGNITFSLLNNDEFGIQVLTEFDGITETNVGKEITLNAQVLMMSNNGVFYTDSNGLQMQKRVLGKRPDFDLKIEGTEHISANYYPINSAITIVDQSKNDAFTILNDRSQGGSSLKEGRIELMIDRRLMKDDFKGLEEALNETDSSGNPLPVKTHSIWLLEKNIQEFSKKNGYSKLKVAQKRLASNVEASIVRNNKALKFNHEKFHATAETSPTFITQVYPVAFDEILIRVENSEDWFTAPSSEYIEFDITDIAKDIYREANPSKKIPSISIQEVTLTAVETIKEREAHRLKWKTEKGLPQPKVERKENALFRQEMRTFKVKFGSRLSGPQIVKE